MQLFLSLCFFALASGQTDFCHPRRCEVCKFIMMANWEISVFQDKGKYMKNCKKIASCCAKKSQFGRMEMENQGSNINYLAVGIFGSLFGFAVAGAAVLMVKYLIDKHRDNSNFNQMRRQSRARSISTDALEKRRLTLTLSNASAPQLTRTLSGDSCGYLTPFQGIDTSRRGSARRQSSLSFIRE
ncbi:Oidioi.mRNA.OKI2018_I69.PAR.g8911.t1.cds [Oikopleura dioica]|uniref:Oidioi.mRNA.OKI2018_I69.PAR.g8911.t1.cds n=1 Tax=Oikopleura dioica TaxID=34765 RepID=A0ABN7RLP7_OIKDI|nr:Oidioi.mRNA.OKI2018_I69.PAR.g8911.t1.cds [Oikopleura dioica]